MTASSDAPPRGPRSVPAARVDASGEVTPAWLRVAVGAVVAAGVIARFTVSSDLWLDEALSVNISTVGWGDLVEALRHDGAPPLYYAMAHLWTDVFGTGDNAVRALSGVLGVASMALALAAGRRIGGNVVGWSAVVVLALNPFALRYATEARMYSLLACLVFGGVVAMRRAYEKPSLGRLAVVAVLVAAVVYTHYWGFFVVAAGALMVVWLAWRGERPDAARRMFVAFAVGGLAFVAWLPTFAYQAEHTGTPWGEPVFPGIPIGTSLLDYAGGYEQEGWLLVMLLVALVLLGVFGRTLDDRSIAVDFVPQVSIRGEAFVGAAALVLGTTVAWIAGSAFQTRYATIALPLAVLAAGRGASLFSDVRLRAAVLGVVVALGAVGAVRNATEQRTQVGEVADALAANAAAGDVVVVCPDQLGPALARVAPTGLDVVTYPRLAPPEFVDWVDYEDVLDSFDPVTVAAAVNERAGDAAIFLVSAPGYRTHTGTCEALGDALSATGRAPVPYVVADEERFERAGLVGYRTG